MGASTMLNRVSTLVNIGYGEELDNDSRNGYTNSETWVRPNSETLVKSKPRNIKLEEYINEEDGILNRRGGKYLSNLCKNNEEFRKEIINFVRDKKKN